MHNLGDRPSISMKNKPLRSGFLQSGTRTLEYWMLERLSAGRLPPQRFLKQCPC